MSLISIAPGPRKIVLSACCFLIAILAVSSMLDRVVAHSGAGQLDTTGHRYFNAAIKRAAYTFAIVRGINGIVSVIQGTDMVVSPAGVGVRFAVGEVLDPINDLVERFSWVVLVSTTSLGIQKLLMEIGVWFGLRFMLTAAMVVLLVGIWMRSAQRKWWFGLGYRLILVALLIRFGLPGIALASDGIYTHFLAQRYADAAVALENFKSDITELDPVSPEPQHQENADAVGYLQRLQTIYQDTRDILNLKDRITALKSRISVYVEHTIDLMIVFLLQTIVIPLVVLWALIRLFGMIRSFPLTLGIKEVNTK